MTWAPIAKTVPQYVDSNGDPYSGAVLKAYSAGTASNISLATSSDGTTTATSIALNSAGYPEVNSSVIIPHVNEDYKLMLYPTQAAADANSGEVWSVDDIPVGAFYDSITNYVKAHVQYVEDDTAVDSTSFDIATNVAAAWESVGPTGSGATNIWTALDSLPSGTKWVKLYIYNLCTDTANGKIEQYVYARVTGSSTAAGVQTMKSAAYCPASTDDDTTALDVVERTVPVDSSNRFDLYFTSDGTSRTVTCYLVGFGT